MNPSDNRVPPEASRRLNPPKPRAFHITEPFMDRGLWSFWLAADQPVLDYVANLSCILQPPPAPFQSRRFQGRVLFAINPRYDHQEAWQWIKQILEDETTEVELNDNWEAALLDAQEPFEDTSPPQEPF